MLWFKVTHDNGEVNVLANDGPDARQLASMNGFRVRTVTPLGYVPLPPPDATS